MNRTIDNLIASHKSYLSTAIKKAVADIDNLERQKKDLVKKIKIQKKKIADAKQQLKELGNGSD